MEKKTCLLVDDSSVVRKVSRRILEPMNFNIMDACDGQDALDKCKEQMPEVILLDWNMPVMDGMEFLKAFRATYSDNGTIVIFCTTENDITKIMLAMEAGANEYIMKPFDEEIIKTKFQQMGLI